MMQKIDRKELVQGVAALRVSEAAGISFGREGDDKYKAVGVTFNFAKKASWVWMAVLFGLLFACQWGAKWLCRDCFASYDNTAREMICGLLTGTFAVWCPLLIVISFWLAARDLKRHPGPQGPR